MTIDIRTSDDIDFGCLLHDRETGLAVQVSREVYRSRRDDAVRLARERLERQVASLRTTLDTVKAASTFQLGEADEGKPCWVLVARQYGLEEWPHRAWLVSIVDRDIGIRHLDRQCEFGDQAQALAYGWQLLADVRAEPRTPDAFPHRAATGASGATKG